MGKEYTVSDNPQKDIESILGKIFNDAVAVNDIDKGNQNNDKVLNYCKEKTVLIAESINNFIKALPQDQQGEEVKISFLKSGLTGKILQVKVGDKAYCLKISKEPLEHERKYYRDNNVKILSEHDSVSVNEHLLWMNKIESPTLHEYLEDEDVIFSNKMEAIKLALKSLPESHKDVKPQNVFVTLDDNFKPASVMWFDPGLVELREMPFVIDVERFDHRGSGSAFFSFLDSTEGETEGFSDILTDITHIKKAYILKYFLEDNFDIGDGEGIDDYLLRYEKNKLDLQRLCYHFQKLKGNGDLDEVLGGLSFDHGSLNKLEDLKSELGVKIYAKLYKGECEEEAGGCQRTGEASASDEDKGKRIFSPAFDLLGTAVFEMDESAFVSVNDAINQWKVKHLVSFNKFRELCLGLNPSKRLDFMQACMDYSDDKSRFNSGSWRSISRESVINSKLNEFRGIFKRDGFRSNYNLVMTFFSCLIVIGILKLACRGIEDRNNQTTTHVKSLLVNQAVRDLTKRGKASSGSDLVFSSN